jgi:hypothetical protein
MLGWAAMLAVWVIWASPSVPVNAAAKRRGFTNE